MAYKNHAPVNQYKSIIRLEIEKIDYDLRDIVPPMRDKIRIMDSYPARLKVYSLGTQ